VDLVVEPVQELLGVAAFLLGEVALEEVEFQVRRMHNLLKNLEMILIRQRQGHVRLERKVQLILEINLL